MQSIEIELKKAIQQAIQKSFDLEVSLEQVNNTSNSMQMVLVLK